jgi:regulator of protease activity HflC (stomatin/prohibitin superfamily)
MLVGFTIFALVVSILLWNLILIVPMREVCVIERLGKYKETLTAGLHFLIPFVDRVSYRHETREQVIDIPPQTCISKDNIQIEVDGLVYLKVMDGKKASYGIENYRLASINLAQTTMRSEVGKLTLGETFSERDSLNETIVKEIDKASEPWGIKVLRYEVKNIKPSENVVHTLEKQMEAEREKRAEVTLADAEKDAMINISIGERQEAINISEGMKAKRINEAQGRAQEISILAEATARGMEWVAAAINKPGGSTAVKMRLLEAFINEFGEILKSADISVIPAQMANIKGIFEGINTVTNTFEGGKK